MKDEFSIDREIRNISTLNSIIGCKKYNGRWDKRFNVCVLSETEDRSDLFGWTGPIRGAYFWWHLGDGKTRGEIGGRRINECDIYPQYPCIDPYGIYHKEVKRKRGELLEDYYKRIKDEALTVSSDVLKGHAHKHGMIYYNERGEIFFRGPKSMKDQVGYPPCPSCMPCPPSMHEPEGFSFRKK